MKRRTKIHQAFIIFIICCGLGLFTVQVIKIIKHYDSRSWVSVEGKIRSATVSEYTYERGGTKRYFYPSVSYEYVIDNKTYESHQIAITPQKYSSSEKAREYLVLNKLQKDGIITVFVNSENQADAVLFSDSNKSTTLHWVFAIFLLFCTIGGIFELFGKLD